GFAAVGEPEVAVCLLPGTELAFQKPVECKRGFGVLPNLVIAGSVARFRQINLDKPRTHHDALEFPNGQVVLLHNLVEGQHTAYAGRFRASADLSRDEVWFPKALHGRTIGATPSRGGLARLVDVSYAAKRPESERKTTLHH